MKRTAFITGGSSGIGLATARIFAQRGGHVALFARDPKRLQDARDALATEGGKVATYPVDVCDRAALTATLDDALEQVGTPTDLILSAGLALPGRFLDQDLSQQQRHFDVNYFGMVNTIRHLVPAMSNAGGGRIGMISSAAGLFGIYGYSAYGPSKAAVSALAEVLRLELEPEQISVTLCSPPDVDTPMLAQENLHKPEATKAITGSGGLMTPDQVAHLLVKGMERGRFHVTPGLEIKALAALASLVKPALRIWQRGHIRKADKQTPGRS